MKRNIFIVVAMFSTTIAFAQASGGQITRPANKTNRNSSVGSNSQRKVIREVYYESTLSTEERATWEKEKAKAREEMRQLAYNIKVQGLDLQRSFSDGVARVKKRDNSLCFINKKGEVMLTLSPSVYDVNNFHDGYAVFQQGNSKKYGIIDKSGKVIVNAVYDFIEDISEGLFCVKKDKKYGFVNKDGDMVIPLIYDDSDSFHEGLAAVKKNNMWGFIDKKGDVEIPFNYNYARNFSEGLAPVKKNEKYGYIDKTNTLIVPFTYSFADPFQFGLAEVIVQNEGNGVKTGFINKAGKYVLPLRNGNMGFYSDGLLATNGTYVDKYGKIQIRTKYDLCRDFSEGLAFVGKIYSRQSEYMYKFGVINKKGQIVIDFEFDGRNDTRPKFSEGLALVWKNHSCGYVDKYGNSTFDFISL